LTNGQNTDFKDAKAAVLSYCSSAQTGAGALLIGYSVALFTLFTLFKDLESTGLGYLFNFGKPDWINWLVENDYIKFGLLLVGAVLITTLIVRTIHRYAAYSGISNYVMYSETCSREKEKSLEYSILHNAFNVMQKRPGDSSTFRLVCHW
jgi:hypothetical protein